MRVVDEVGDGLADQLAVADQLRPVGGLDRERRGPAPRRPARKARRRRRRSRRDRTSAHALGHGAGLEPRDQQQRVEGLDQLVGLLDRLHQRRRDSAGAAVGVAQRRLGAVAQAVERRLEIMGDVVGDLAQARISSSMRSSMALRLSARRSSSSPVPSSGMRRERSPAMIVRLASVMASMRRSTLRLTKRPAPSRARTTSSADAPQRSRPMRAGEALQILDVAADDQRRPPGRQAATPTRSRRAGRRAPGSAARSVKTLPRGRRRQLRRHLVEIAGEPCGRWQSISR